jgi:hypothetical protein
VAAVNYGGMSINKASKVYNVPRNKITERVSKVCFDYIYIYIFRLGLWCLMSF